MIKYLQLPLFFDVPQLQEDLRQLPPSAWIPHYQHRHYEGGWSAIPLRSINGNKDSILVAPEDNAEYADTAYLAHTPYFRELLTRFSCPLQAVRLLKLDAGALIHEHRDFELCFEQGSVRLHIPVITSDDVEFYLDKERLQPAEGTCWYMNFNLPHSLRNNGATDRVHLVIDALVNDWLTVLFAQPAVQKKEYTGSRYDETTQRQIIFQLRQMGTDTGRRLADEMEAALVKSGSSAN